MADETLRIGVVGAGGIVRNRHMPGLAAIDGVEVVAVANRSMESGQRFADEFGVGAVYDDWHQVVESEQVDIVWIGTWPYLHREITVAALKAGKHVFCQARMARNAQEGREMLEAAEGSDRTTMICPPPHALEGDPAVRRLLREGAIGELRHVRVHSCSGGLIDPEAPASWRLAEEYSGNNALDLGICAEIVHNWVGYPRRVDAVGHIYHPERPDPEHPGAVRNVSCLEHLSVICDMSGRGGVVAQATPFTASYTHSGHVPVGDFKGIELFGNAGTLRYHFFQHRIELAKPDVEDGAFKPLELSGDDRQEWTVERDFIDAVRSGERFPEPSFRTGLRYMQFVDSVLKSAKARVSVLLRDEDVEPSATGQATV